jgi:hypothetical protein
MLPRFSGRGATLPMTGIAICCISIAFTEGNFRVRGENRGIRKVRHRAIGSRLWRQVRFSLDAMLRYPFPAPEALAESAVARGHAVLPVILS